MTDANFLTRFVQLNIQKGGGKVMPQIMDEIDKLAPDMAVFTEVTYKNLAYIESRFHASGLIHATTLCIKGGKSSVLIASKMPLQQVHRKPAFDQERRICVYVPDLHLHLVAVHIPSSGCHVKSLGLLGDVRKGMRWDEILSDAEEYMEQRAIFIGDFNTGFNNFDRSGGSRFTHEDRLRKLGEFGYSDAYRLCDPAGREYTYYSLKDGGTDNNGFRIDQVHVSSCLRGRVVRVEHVHHVRGSRRYSQKLTDHAIVIADIDLGGENLTR